MGPMSPVSLAAALKVEARRLGLDLVGIAPAHPFTKEATLLAERAAASRGSPFEEADIALRTQPDLELPGVRSIIAAGMAYGPSGADLRREQPGAGAAQPEPDPPRGGRGRLSRYCRGRDYHYVLSSRLAALADWLRRQVPTAATRVCVDTAPPIDRAVAQRAGLGFFGHSANLITADFGTWVFLGELLTDVELAPDTPATGTCGSCTRCIDACPTAALVAPGVVDNDTCLSYLTQIKGSVPEQHRVAMGNLIFGCDICQDVCPYNLRMGVPGTPHPEFQERPIPGGDAGPPLAALLSMTKSQFRDWFRPTAAAWRGKTVLQRNAVIALGNSGDPKAVDLLLPALTHQRPVLRGHAVWALARLAAGANAARETTARVQQALQQLVETETDADVQRELAAALAQKQNPAPAGRAIDDPDAVPSFVRNCHRTWPGPGARPS